MKANWMLSLGLAACVSWPALAADNPRPKEDKQAASGQAKQSARLAEEYGVTNDEVKILRDKGMGWGEISHALSISRKSGKPVSEITALRDKGMGWGQIAKEQGFRLGDVEKRGPRNAGPSKDTGAPMKTGEHGRSQGHGADTSAKVS